MGRYAVRPLTERTWMMSSWKRKRSQFTTSWLDTENLLVREVEFLEGKNLAIGVDVHESDFRLDGTLRVRARASTPAVEVAFESKHGPLLYRCDQYESGPYQNKMEPWQHNVRAIALTLEAARAMDRYGATQTGQQYVGFKALGSGQASEPEEVVFTYQQACDWLRSEEATGILGGEGLSLKAAYKLAARNHHPDFGHGGGMWHKVDVARRVLRENGEKL